MILIEETEKVWENRKSFSITITQWKMETFSSFHFPNQNHCNQKHLAGSKDSL